jgi:hypothetical protein
MNGTFKEWFDANKEGETLNEGYAEYKCGTDDKPRLTFRQWAKTVYEYETKM